MRKRNALWISLLIPIMLGLITREAFATATVSVAPSNYEAPNVGATFTLTVNIAGVSNLFAYEIKVYYNTTQLDAKTITLPTNHFLKPVDASKIFTAKQEIKDDYNATHGYVWVAISLLYPETPKTGSGTLFTVDFEADALGGPSPITPYSPPTGAYDPAQYPIKLSDVTATPIPCTVTPGYVTVIPEFPLALIPIFMIITLISVILGRTAWTKKRKSTFATT